MIPVYPLTEDLRPGDIFLVETPIQEQAAEYDRGGFLRLEQHFGRLDSLPYSDFYGTSYGVPSKGWPADYWNSEPADSPRDTAAPSDRWSEAPAAAYPTYSFRVKAGKAASLALPIKSVPIGVSYLNAKDLRGSVTIADANTYGLSLDQLRAAFEHWYYDNARVRTQVTRIRLATDTTVYLRLISRVFLAKRVVVGMDAQESKGGSARAGTGSAPALPETGMSAESAYTAQRAVLQQALTAADPGGGITLLQSSNRTVSMSETFKRPLVVGYLSFDFPVEADGTLGPPAATLARLERSAPPLATLGASTRTSRQLKALLLYVESLTPAQQQQVRDLTARTMRSEFRAMVTQRSAGESPSSLRSVVNAYMLGKSPFELHQREVIAAIERALELQGEN